MEQNREYKQALRELLPAEKLARCLIEIRMGLGLSQAGLADRVGVSKEVISDLENADWTVDQP